MTHFAVYGNVRETVYKVPDFFLYFAGSDMTLILDLETSCKVTVHPLTLGTL